MLEHAAVLELVDVRRVLLVFFAADAALAAVAREVALAVRELLHGDEAFIPAFAAAVRARLGLEIPELLRAEQRRRLCPRLERENRRAVCAHQSRDVGADDVLAEDVF